MHSGVEEMIFVLSGTLTVRTPEGMEELSPDDIVYFPERRDGRAATKALEPEKSALRLLSASRPSGYRMSVRISGSKSARCTWPAPERADELDDEIVELKEWRLRCAPRPVRGEATRRARGPRDPCHRRAQSARIRARVNGQRDWWADEQSGPEV